MQELIIHTNIKQGSDDWHRLRLGKITGSRFSKMLGVKKACERYLYDIANEIITGALSDGEEYTNLHMRRGYYYEHIARLGYSAVKEVKVDEVGIIEMGGYIACSPDGLVGEDGMIEIKVPDSNNYFRCILDISEKGESAIPKEHYIQMQFYLYVCRRQWCDYVLYNPKHVDVADNKGLFIYRVEVDSKIQERIHKAIEEGITTIDRLIATYYEVTRSPIIS